MLQAVIFDAFGTLLHRPIQTKAYREIIRQSSLPARKVLDISMRQDFASLQAFAEAVDAKEVDIENLEANLLQDLEAIHLYEDSLPTLQALQQQGYRIAVISNLSSPYAEPLHSLLNDHVDVIVYSCRLGAKKPEPGIYEHALEQLGCSAEQVVMVGDSLKNDYLKPLELGMQSVFLDRNRKSSKVNEDVPMINHLTELLSKTHFLSKSKLKRTRT